jgi:hypothetical protein
VDPPIEIDVPAFEPTNIFRVEAIVAAVIAEADEVVALLVPLVKAFLNTAKA